jgi:acyl transferase domain-containing protein
MEPIAIIGVGCRFPGAAGPDEFWDSLARGVDAITEVPADRWDADALYDADPAAPGKMITRYGGFLTGVDQFDRDFFGISPLEAAAVDPQQRLLLEVAWEALEDAGQVTTALAGTDTGVFVGISTYDYALLQAPRLDGIDAYWGTGVALSVAANRISYVLDLRGPSIAVDTACSSSLVALYSACQSLWSGQSQLAVAGGVNLVLAPSFAVNFTKAGVMAPDGRCKAFDAAADGYVRGEGAGVVVLKPLRRALEDHDPVRAVIRGGAVGQDGRTNGLMAPNSESQEALLRAAYRHSDVAPGEVDYVEAHGTGTRLGDAMEAEALGRVVGSGRPAEVPCVIGSVKSNIGHLEAAAGIAGIIKAVLMLEHREIPASLHVRQTNPRIDFDALRLRVARAHQPWPRRTGPARIGVSSFGFGGTGAHLVLEEAPPVRPDGDGYRRRAHGPFLVPLSARSPAALRQVADRTLARLVEPGGAAVDVADLAATAATRRSHHRHRLAVVADGREEAAAQLQAFVAGESRTGTHSGRTGRHRLVFVCSGQGPVWWPLDPALRDEPAVLGVLRECDELIRAQAGFSLLEQLRGDEGSSRLAEADVGQPALFAVQIALAALWRSWGIVPDAVVGHSMGEVAAAYLAGALSLPDAVRVVCRRGRVIRSVAGRGRMAVVELSAEAVRDELRGLEDHLSVAAVNSPDSTVVSGDPGAVGELVSRFAARGVFHRVLQSVDFASHSPQMEPLTGDLTAALAGIVPMATRSPMYSTVTGTAIDGTALDGGYWARNLREPVLFATAVDGLLDQGYDTFVELSPHPGLLPATGRTAQARGRQVTLLPSLHRDRPASEVMLTSLGALYAAGADPDWSGLYPGRRRPVRLPGYPWQRERCWVASPAAPPAWSAPAGGHPLLGHHLQLAGTPGDHAWESTITTTSSAALGDHRVQDVAVLPGAAWLEMVRAAAESFAGDTVVLRDTEFRRLLLLDTAATVQLRMSPADDGETSVHAYAHHSSGVTGQPEWTLHMTATVVPGPAAAGPARPDVDAVRRRCATPVTADDFYQAMAARGLRYGPSFRALGRLWRGEREAVATVVATPGIDSEAAVYGVHPVLLDASLQVLAAALDGAADSSDRGPWLPVSIDRVSLRPVRKGQDDVLWAHARLRPGDEAVTGGVAGDVWLTDGDGATVAIFEGVHVRQPDSGQGLPGPTSLDEALYEVRWRRQDHAPAHRPSPGSGGWLVFADGRGIATALVDVLAGRGESTVQVLAGDVFDDSDPHRLTVRPGHAGDVQRAVETAQRRLGGLAGVVHLWGTEQATLAEAQQRGVVNVLHMIHALTRDATEVPAVRLWLLTRGVHDVAGFAAPVAVEHAPLWGLGRVAAHEHPELRTTLVDLDPAAGPEAARWLAAELRADDPETQVAVRGGRRHVARLVRRTVPRAAPADLVRGDATYLVTGGTGALGLLVARWLVDRGARHLLLISRRGAGDIAERKLRELRDAGVQVRVAPADVSDDVIVGQVLSDAAASMPPLAGVVHAAGVLDDATLRTLDANRLLAVLQPKVAGAWTLHMLTACLPLDFFVMFSSFAGVLGSPGQANYAAANSYLDALAAMLAAQGRPATSIAWGPWEGMGLSVRPGDAGRVVRRSGVDGIEPADGMRMLDLLLGDEAPQTAVARIDWQRWAASSPAAAGSPLISELVAADGPVAPPAPASPRRGALTTEELYAADPADRPGLLEMYLHGAIARALNLPAGRLDADRPLTEAGLDSLVAVGMKNQIEVDLGMSLPLAAALEGASVRELAARMLADAGSGTEPSRDDGSGPDSWEEFDIF